MRLDGLRCCVGRGGVNECCVESDLVLVLQHGGPEHGDAQHGGPEHGDAQHTDPEHGHTKVLSYPLSTVMFHATPWLEMLCEREARERVLC